jgi:tetratricopeptide (TPR) repeat protein
MKLKIALLIIIVASLSLNAFSQSYSGANPKALDAMTKGNFRVAIRILDEDINENKNLFPSFRLRSDLKRMTGDFSGAFADLNKAIEIKADDGTLFQQRSDLRMILRHDMNLVLSDLDLAIANGVKHEKVYSSRGMIRLNTGDSDGAISDYETAIGLRPDLAQAHLGLSSAYQRKGDVDKALEVLENFVTGIETSSKRIRTVKGTVTATSSVDLPSLSDDKIKAGQISVITRREAGQGDPATIEEMQRSNERLEQSKNTATAYFTLASLYDKKAEYEKAFATVEKGLAIDPTDFYGYETRGRIRIGLKDYQGALIDLNKAIGMIQGIGGMYLSRGIAYMMLDKNLEAERDFEKFLQFFPQGQKELERRKKLALDARSSQ